MPKIKIKETDVFDCFFTRGGGTYRNIIDKDNHGYYLRDKNHVNFDGYRHQDINTLFNCHSVKTGQCLVYRVNPDGTRGGQIYKPKPFKGRVIRD